MITDKPTKQLLINSILKLEHKLPR